jgi:uncharacterized protein with von Willebrand factor type A (vWA) domain
MSSGDSSGAGAPAAALLRGVDLAGFATGLGLVLRARGVDVSLTGIETFTRALRVSPPVDRTALYWVARLTLVHRAGDLATFDAVFEAVFADAVLALDPHARRHAVAPSPSATGPDEEPDHSTSRHPDEEGGGLPWAQLSQVTAVDDDEDAAVESPERWPSSLEAVADLPFADLDPDQLGLLEDWLRTALLRWPTRISRRMGDSHSGRRISLRRTLAGARRTGFEPVDLRHERPRRKPRRLLMVCDVSQSMQPYAAAHLHLMRAAALVTDAEVFAFSTTLTRLTAVLRHTSPEIAIRQAGERVTDRFGGTRIASNLRVLLGSHHGEYARGAIVVVASDGWDSDDPAELARVMARLRRRAHRVIWLNPRAAAPGYAPLVGGMAAALPYCDALLPAHTVRDLAAVVDAITAPSLELAGVRALSSTA